jgi:hypothetical protein
MFNAVSRFIRMTTLTIQPCISFNEFVCPPFAIVTRAETVIIGEKTSSF